MASKKDKTYSITLNTEEMSGAEIGTIMDHLNNDFVTVLLLPDDPGLLLKITKLLKEHK